MIYFLRKSDYFNLIKIENLDIVTSTDEVIRVQTELAAEEEMKSYLRHRYEMPLVFAPLQDWLVSNVYKWGDRVYLTAPIYSDLAVYLLGQRVTYLGSVYASISGSSAHAFNPLEWALIGVEGHYQMQAKAWDVKTPYLINETVRVERKYFKALTNNTGINPLDSPLNWVEVVNQTGNGLANTNYWVVGDSRNKHLLMLLVDLTLYHLHSRINPRNIPEFRITRREDCISYLTKIAKGLISAELELIIPEQGKNIAFGSKPLQNNTY